MKTNELLFGVLLGIAAAKYVDCKINQCKKKQRQQDCQCLTKKHECVYKSYRRCGF